MSPTLLRTLSLAPAHHPQGRVHLGAASALVRVDRQLYVVADDELHLGLFILGDPRPGRLVQLFEGALPAEKVTRKAAKPDLEVLALLPATKCCPEGMLLALGSGSTPERWRGVLLGLEDDARPHQIDLAPLYQPLRQRFADLNIEGGFRLDDEFLLLQRGNQGQTTNAAVHYSWGEFRDWLTGEGGVPIPHVQPLDLGELAGVALGFTDGAALADGRWLFSAVAEDTTDSYRDGACLGAVIGLAERDGRVRRLAELDGKWKVEGIALDEAGDLLLVTDADDPATASSLLHLPLSGLLGQ